MTFHRLSREISRLASEKTECSRFIIDAKIHGRKLCCCYTCISDYRAVLLHQNEFTFDRPHVNCQEIYESVLQYIESLQEQLQSSDISGILAI